MTFEEILDQAVAMLQRRGRVTYRTLKVQFQLDDDLLDTLKDELLFSHPVVDDEDRGLVWTAERPALEPATQGGTEAESRFHAVLSAMIALLQREGRVTYRTLEQIFVLDKPFLDNLRHELIFKQLARDEHGEGLVWTGEAYPVASPATASHPHAVPGAANVMSPTAPTHPPLVAKADTVEPTPTAPKAERRQLTVMFCDLADSTKLSQQLDPEDLREVVRAYQESAAEVIEQYEGHMAQYLGDGLLIYFGWPVAHEDDVQRSLHAGLGIVEAIATSLNPRLEQEKGVQLTVRIGVHTGPVVVGEMGGGGRHENLATGETVNVASRLEGLAAPNTVLISNVTARLVRGVFELEGLGRHELKGVVEPMPVFRVLGPVVEHDTDDELVSGGIPMLVGRDEEMGLLVRRWEQAKEGLGQVVLISGEAGIGKSSLVATLRHHVMAGENTRITLRCSPYHTNSALYPVIEHVQRVLQLQPGDTPETRLDKLERVLGSYSRPLEEVIPLYATLLSVPVPEGRYPALNVTPQQQRQHTQDALVGWLLEEAERQPTLAMWEDLHWADPSTLEMLGLVLEQTPTVPMLHVLTFRPEFESPWSTRSHMTPITLNRLERPQVEALITHLTRSKALPHEVSEHIVAKTDGVPLYVEELTKMILESDLLREGAEQYVLTGPLLTVAIPDTLQDSLMARLDQMNTAKEVAQLGAVLGREFPYTMLQAISSQDEETVQSGLAQLVEAELLYQRGRPPRARYIFKHALIQDAAYESLLRSTRHRVHQQIAQLLEECFPETVETQPELVAHHYTEGGYPEQAMSYWQTAGQLAARRSAYHEAIAHLSKGLEVLALLPETPERTQQELDLQMALGPVVMTRHGYAASEVERIYTRAYALCQQMGETLRLFPVLRGLWMMYFVRAEHERARQLADQYFTLVQRQDDVSLLLEAHRNQGSSLCCLGELTSAKAHLEQCIALSDFQQHRTHTFLYGQDSGVAALMYAAWTLWLLGYPDQALTSCHKALTLASELAHPFSQTFALVWSIWLYQFRQDLQAAYEQVEAVLALSTEHGFAQWLAHGAILGGWVLADQGQTAEAIDQLQQGLAAYRATTAGLFLPWFMSLLAKAYGGLGQTDKGFGMLVESLALIDSTGERFCEAELHRLKGESLLRHADPDASQAESCFHQALTIARRQQAKSWELRAATSLACLWHSQDKRQEAYELLEPVYSWFTEGFDTADLMDAKDLLNELG